MTHHHKRPANLAPDPSAAIPAVPPGLLAAAIDFLAEHRPAPVIATQTVIRLAVALGYDATVSASLCLRIFAASRLMAGPRWRTVQTLRARLSSHQREPFARAIQQFIATAPLDAHDDFDGADLVRALLPLSTVHGHG